MTKRHDSTRSDGQLAPMAAQAEYLLLVVGLLMLWTAGFVDLLLGTTERGAVFGLYTLTQFALILAYGCVYLVWLWLIFAPNGLSLLKKGIAYLHRKTWAGLLFYLTLGGVGFTFVVWDAWRFFPLLAVAMFLSVLIVGLFVLLIRPEPQSKMQGWRKALLSLAFVYVLLEALLQVGAAYNGLPASMQTTTSLFLPYGRIYQTQEGFANGLNNFHGFYYPEFRLTPGAIRTVVVGDSFVQAHQVHPTQNMGYVLNGLQQQEKKSALTEVMSVGLPDYGPGLYLDTILFPFVLGPLHPHEVIVVFHLANDVQTINGPSATIPAFIINEKGEVVIHPDDPPTRHRLQHVIITNYEPVRPLMALRSQLFTWSFVEAQWRNLRGKEPSVPTYPTNLDSATAALPFGASSFVFERNGSPEAQRTMTIATGLLRNYQQYTQKLNIKMYLVTIPHFPAAFYAQYQGRDWSPELGKYDLLRPERELQQFAKANGIPMLPMGQYMQRGAQTPAQIKSLFFKDGVGHLTPDGHAFFAQAMYNCFYNVNKSACPIE